MPKNQEKQRAGSNFLSCILSLLSRSEEFQRMGDRIPNSNQNINRFFLPLSLPLWDEGLYTVCEKCVNPEIPGNQELQRADSHFSGGL